MLHLNRFKSVNLYFVRLQQRERGQREGGGREREDERYYLHAILLYVGTKARRIDKAIRRSMNS